MKKIFNVVMMLVTCLLVTACGDDSGQDAAAPVSFGARDYTIMYGRGASIPFTGGSGVYELTASNPEVLGRFGIDTEAPDRRLYIQPAKAGESYLTIRDVKTEAVVTLHFTVDDFYLAFRIDEIEGENTNKFFETGRRIRFIRNDDNTKPVKVVWQQNMTFRLMTVGEGLFDIIRSEANIFTMTLALHYNSGEDSALHEYEYAMSGDGEYMSLFDSIFGFGWKADAAPRSSRSQPVRSIKMILTDKDNGCKITCVLEPWSVEA